MADWLQIISLAVSVLIFLGTTIGIYLKLKLDLAELSIKIKNIERELLQKEISFLLSEKNNREDHKNIINKIDRLIDNLILSTDVEK